MGCCANEKKEPAKDDRKKTDEAELEKRIDELYAKYDKDNNGGLDNKETMALLNDILKDHNQTVSEK